MSRSIFITRNLPEQIMSKFCNAGLSISQWEHETPVPRDVLLKSVRSVDGIFCMLTDKIDKEVLQAADRLRVVSTMSVGFDHVDVPSLRERGVRLGFTPDILTDATAELTMALLLAATRRLPEAMNAARTGEWTAWRPFWMCGRGLAGSTVGIVGMGRIGRAIADRLRPFNVARIVYSCLTAHPDVAAEFVSLDSLLRQSDFVVACCALTPETRHLFNADAFRAMKPSAIFVNTSRGDVVNQEDLQAALAAGHIGGAALDVTTPEPLPTNHPLFREPKCLILPHVGSATTQTRMAMAELAAENLICGLRGDPMPAEVTGQ